MRGDVVFCFRGGRERKCVMDTESLCILRFDQFQSVGGRTEPGMVAVPGFCGGFVERGPGEDNRREQQQNKGQIAENETDALFTQERMGVSSAY